MSITLFLLLACVIFSISAFNNRDLFYKLDFQPYMIERNREWYRFISHAFLHADWGHLVINMFVLYQFGRFVEGAYASLFPEKWIFYFLLLYLGSILFSTIPGYARNRTNYAYHAVGASGAVSAVVYSFIVIAPTAPLRLFFVPIDIPAWIFGLGYLGLEYYLDRNSKSNIAHSAHYFGAIFGVVYTVILEPQLILRFF